MQHYQKWAAMIRGCTDLACAAEHIACALTEASGAEATGVFLLDYLKQNLVLYASSTRLFGAVTHSDLKIPMDMLHERDPLCFAVREGQTYLSDMVPVFPASISLFCRLKEYDQRIGVCPLFGQENRVIGGVALAFRHEITTFGGEFLSLCDFSALHLDSLIQQKENQSRQSPEPRISGKVAQDIPMEEGLGSLAVFQGKSRAVGELRKTVELWGRLDVPVLIAGEPGTQQTEIAAALHMVSQRNGSPFSVIRCGALSPQILESELFGHIRGAFVGADSDYTGQIRSADAGTVVLDEIDSLPPELQGKISALALTAQLRPVGGARPYSVRTRLLATTTRDLPSMVQEGLFRQDLVDYFSPFSIAAPPLRSRQTDIPQIVEHLLVRHREKSPNEKIQLSTDALWSLMQHEHPGNISGLSQLLFRALTIASSEGRQTIEQEMLFSAPAKLEHIYGSTLPELVRSFEEPLILNALAMHGQNIPKTAEALGIPASTLRSKIKGILPPER